VLSVRSSRPWKDRSPTRRSPEISPG